ncbi:ArsR/SmtB family transcription factor [Pseudomonas sp. SDO528_S397]
MDHAPCISQIATLLADPKRTAMLWALMDGSAKPIDELAMVAGVSAASAKAHLLRLATGGLLRVELNGSRRLFRVAAPDVSVAVNALATTTMASAARSSPMICPPLVAPTALRQARVCRGHLGGELAARLYQRMLKAGWVDGRELRIEVTPKGARKLEGLGIFTQALAQPLACECLDWGAQQPHLGGALGAALLQLFIQAGWASVINESLALHISPAGHEEIARLAACEHP